MKKNVTSNVKQFHLASERKSFSLFFLIVILIAILSFLIMFVSDYGFDPQISYINKEIIFVLIISGFCLGTSSFIVQTISKNKLADTSILGIGSVNLLVLVVMVISLNLGNQNSVNTFNFSLPFLFILFSALAAIVIFLLSKKNKFNISKKFILAGVLFNFVFSAFATSISSLMTSTKQQIINSFSSGKINQSNHEIYIPLALIVSFICVIWMFFILRKYKITTSNELVASQLGINVKNIYFQAMLISGILTGISFFMCGNISFLGLLVGNISYAIFKRNFKYTFICSGLIGFLVLGFTYFINRNILTNTNVNTSYLIPLIACPYFLYLIIKK